MRAARNAQRNKKPVYLSVTGQAILLQGGGDILIKLQDANARHAIFMGYENRNGVMRVVGNKIKKPAIFQMRAWCLLLSPRRANFDIASVV